MVQELVLIADVDDVLPLHRGASNIRSGVGDWGLHCAGQIH